MRCSGGALVSGEFQRVPKVSGITCRSQERSGGMFGVVRGVWGTSGGFLALRCVSFEFWGLPEDSGCT